MAEGKITGGQDNIDVVLGNKEDRIKVHKQNLELLKKYEKDAVKIEERLQKLRKTGLNDFEKTATQLRKERLDDELDKLRERYEIEQDLAKKAQIEQEIRDKKSADNRKDLLEKTLQNTVNKVTGVIDTQINQYLGAYSKYTSSINTRLQGADKTFQSINSLLTRSVGINPFVTQTKVMEKLSSLVEQGINYNVEQRAFLGTISEKIATTFDAANGTLLQLIKIQQADSTAARLGLESSLNKFFNNTFKDTSYLSGLSDTVASNILGANSQLSRDGSVAFEYVVQKWLGSMSSVGVSDNTISMLAQGLNYLGTGDVDALNNNTALQNLLVMAANNAGIDYSKLLTGGLNASTANKLLQGVVQYGQQIANTNNQVVKSQYAQLFGMTVADLTSLLNLSSQDLVSISKNMLTYSNAIEETENGLATLYKRTSMSEMVENLFGNVMGSLGEGVAKNPATYATWLITDMIEKATGGINIPFVNAMGFGIDLNASVEQLMKLGIVGVGTLGNIGNIISGLTRIAGFDLDAFGAEATTGRGRGLASTYADSNVATSISNTNFIGNTNSSEIYSSSVTAAQDEATASVQGQEENEVVTLLRDHIAPDVATIVQLLATDGIVVREINTLNTLGLLGG